MNGIALTTELIADSMATYVFAMGDSRAYTRALWPASIEDGTTHLMRACTVADVIALGTAMEGYTESKLIAVTLSVLYDEAGIPVSDTGIEDTYAILFAGNKTGWQLKIPNVNSLNKAEATADILPYARDPETGKIPKAVVNAVPKPDKRARMSA